MKVTIDLRQYGEYGYSEAMKLVGLICDQHNAPFN